MYFLQAPSKRPLCSTSVLLLKQNIFMYSKWRPLELRHNYNFKMNDALDSSSAVCWTGVQTSIICCCMSSVVSILDHSAKKNVQWHKVRRTSRSTNCSTKCKYSAPKINCPFTLIFYQKAPLWVINGPLMHIPSIENSFV